MFEAGRVCTRAYTLARLRCRVRLIPSQTTPWHHLHLVTQEWMLISCLRTPLFMLSLLGVLVLSGVISIYFAVLFLAFTAASVPFLDAGDKRVITSGPI